MANKISQALTAIGGLTLITVGIMLGIMLCDAIGSDLTTFKWASLSFISFYCAVTFCALAEHLRGVISEVSARNMSLVGAYIITLSALILYFLVFNAILVRFTDVAWGLATLIIALHIASTWSRRHD